MPESTEPPILSAAPASQLNKSHPRTVAEVDSSTGSTAKIRPPVLSTIVNVLTAIGLGLIAASLPNTLLFVLGAPDSVTSLVLLVTWVVLGVLIFRRQQRISVKYAMNALKQSASIGSAISRSPSTNSEPTEAEYAAIVDRVNRSEAMSDASDQIDEFIASQKAFGGPSISPERRTAMIKERAEALYVSGELVRLEAEAESRNRRREETRHRELVNAIKTSDPIGRALDFSEKHPFLSGMLGAALAHKLKKK